MLSFPFLAQHWVPVEEHDLFLKEPKNPVPIPRPHGVVVIRWPGRG